MGWSARCAEQQRLAYHSGIFYPYVLCSSGGHDARLVQLVHPPGSMQITRTQTTVEFLSRAEVGYAATRDKTKAIRPQGQKKQDNRLLDQSSLA